MMLRARIRRVAITCAVGAIALGAVAGAPAAAASWGVESASSDSGTAPVEVPRETSTTKAPVGLEALVTSLVGVAVFVTVTGVALQLVERREAS